MNIVLIGSTGLIGTEIGKALSARHEVVQVGHSSGDLRVDITSKKSIEMLFEKLGRFDALVCAAGSASFGNFTELGDEDFARSLSDKLMGQVNLVRAGIRHIADNGSFTLTTGVLAHHPIPGSAAVSMVNGGLESFVKAAALEMPRGVRINVVSPPWATETLEKLGMDTTHGTAVAKFAEAYREAIEGASNGAVIELSTR